MKGKTLSNEKAVAAVGARRQQKAYKLLQSDLGEVGAGTPWDESGADRAAVTLEELKDELLQDEIKLDSLVKSRG